MYLKYEDNEINIFVIFFFQKSDCTYFLIMEDSHNTSFNTEMI